MPHCLMNRACRYGVILYAGNVGRIQGKRVQAKLSTGFACRIQNLKFQYFQPQEIIKSRPQLADICFCIVDIGFCIGDIAISALVLLLIYRVFYKIGLFHSDYYSVTLATYFEIDLYW